MRPEDIIRELDGGENIRVFKPRTERQGGTGKANGAASYRDFAISAVELEAMHFQAVKFVVADILPVGLAVLSAPPKIGKTWFDFGAADAIAAGTAFAGIKATDKGAVLLLDLEGNRRRAQRRFRQLRESGGAPAGLDVANEWPRMDRGGLDLIRQWAADHPDRKAVFIDVWVCFRQPRPKNADPYQFDYETAKAVRDLAHELGVAIVLVHHNRKAADADFLYEISGSNGLAAAADTILVIRRDRSASDAVLHVTGRDVEEQELALSFDKKTGRWSIIGDAEEYRKAKTRRDIFGLLDVQGPKTPKEVAEELGIKHELAKKTLQRMMKDGAVKGAGAGQYAVP